MTDRVPTLCDQCGQTDDHPKIHGTAQVPVFNEDGSPVLNDQGQQVTQASTKHHDCLSHVEEQVVRDSSDTAAAIIDACKGGKRGAKLHAHIESLHKEV